MLTAEHLKVMMEDPGLLEESRLLAERLRALVAEPKVQEWGKFVTEVIEDLAEEIQAMTEAPGFQGEHIKLIMNDPEVQEQAKVASEQLKAMMEDRDLMKRVDRASEQLKAMVEDVETFRAHLISQGKDDDGTVGGGLQVGGPKRKLFRAFRQRGERLFVPSAHVGARSSTAIRSAPPHRPQPTMLAPAPLEAAMTLLAKSEADELLGEAFRTFPIFFTGGVLGYLAGQVAVKEELLDEDLAKFLIPAGAVFTVVLANTGALNAVSGTAAKALLDAWNIFASAVLPGAILKY